MNSRRNCAVVSYVASPHAGYLALFKKYQGSDLYVLGSEFIQEYPELVKHLPGNTPEDARTMIQALGIFSAVRILTPSTVSDLHSYRELVFPEEQVSRAWASAYLPNIPVSFDGTWRLRWDWHASSKGSLPDDLAEVTTTVLDTTMMSFATKEAQKSSDWWRQVGAVVAHDGIVLLAAHNQHLPSEQTAYLEGDPRSSFSPGVSIDVSVALHAEIAILAEAARRGISLEGCDLYVTTFPCPPCANAVAQSGIRRLFFREGYSLVAGADALRSRNVTLIRVV